MPFDLFSSLIDVRIGDCRDELHRLPSQSINCIVTSPPYYGLRDYEHSQQIGHEKTVDDYIKTLVEIFRQCKRVLRNDGTLWINIGDIYTRGPSGTLVGSTLKGSLNYRIGSSDGFTGRAERAGGRISTNLPIKSLVGVPWRLAFALQSDGWILRDEIIWHKPNAMPESVKDRCVRSHEYLFMFSKNGRYFYDQDAIKEPAIWAGKRESRKKGSFNGKYPHTFRAITETKTKRSVWTITTKKYRENHFATFPPDLIKPCILAGCPRHGTVLDPFAGSGTTGMVARQNGREAVLIELNPQYEQFIKERIK